MHLAFTLLVYSILATATSSADDLLNFLYLVIFQHYAFCLLGPTVQRSAGSFSLDHCDHNDLLVVGCCCCGGGVGCKNNVLAL